MKFLLQIKLFRGNHADIFQLFTGTGIFMFHCEANDM